MSLQVNGLVAAEYELEHLLLEGHCFDLSTGQPPRGLQFTLGMSRDPLMYDTIVMANLVSSLLHSSLDPGFNEPILTFLYFNLFQSQQGYFQLKANPGAWTLRLRKGRSEEIYQVLS